MEAALVRLNSGESNSWEIAKQVGEQQRVAGGKRKASGAAPLQKRREAALSFC
jgi:hypothetical protein